MKRTKTALSQSFIAMLLCLSMLIGSTFAWFTDNVTSTGNIIKSGNLDIEMYWTDDLDSGVWYDVEDEEHNTIFSYENWEPGYTDVKYIKLVNNGNLALNYKLTLTPQNEVGKLAEVINVYFANSGIDVESRDDLDHLGAIGLLNNVLNGGATADGTLLAANQESPLHPSGEVVMTIAMSMITSAGNDYQGQSSGDFTITALATQAAFESDSFGSNYDSNADYSTALNPSQVSATVTPVDGKVPDGGVTMSGNGISAFVPAGAVLEDNTQKLTLSVTPLQNTTSGISVVNNEILIPVDVHIDGISEDNTMPVIIDLGEILPKYMNMGNYHLYHVENGENAVMTLVDDRSDLVAHNQFTYDPLTGAVSVAMASFSEVAIVADTSRKWGGEYDYKWYTDEAKESKTFAIANADQLYAFSKIVGGMAVGIETNSYDFADATVKLLCDINLNSGKATPEGENKTRIFYPIGYNNNKGTDTRDNEVDDEDVSSSVFPFAGTFDGNGHTISNFYQNTWEMFGDYNDGYSGTPNYYADAMGLFGYVNGGTVKNLTVDSFESDGEFTPTGVITAYAANSTFENIAITNCNPRVYNTGNGGIIGIAGNYNDQGTEIKLKNITVDNSNTISALWGSYDVACGGLVGMFRGNAGGGTGTISFENCHVAAQMDVYNDVCANYQYYWYRYSGMIIGSIRHNVTIDGSTYPDMTGISAEGCTVHFGTWNDYYYCEFEKNTMASYSEDYQFSRIPHSELVFDDSDDNEVINTPEERASVTGCRHDHTPEEDKQAVYLPFDQLFTGYGWGVTSKGLKDVGDLGLGITILDRVVADSAVKFEKNETAMDGYATGATVTIGELFKAAQIADNKLSIQKENVQVTVSPVDENSNVSATYVADTSDWTKGTLTFSGAGDATITITDYYFCTPTTIKVNIGTPEFAVVFENVDDYIYRVGNQNTVVLGSLFKTESTVVTGATINVTITALDNSSVSGTYTAASDTTKWAEGTIKFTGTGLAMITINDCELTVEIVDAVNATSATSATKNNVVLLNDVGLHTLEVSNGYTLYGNGFKMTATNDIMYDAMNAGFVVLKNGTLDNVQIVCPNFSYAIVYNNQIKSSENTAVPSDSNNDARGNVRSAVMVDGNSQIFNSYIHGGRAAIFLRSGNLVVDSSTISGGAAANIHTMSAQSLTLRNATLIQKPFKANVNDTSKTVMGFSGLFECDESGNATPVILEGSLIQDAWINESYKQYVPSEASSIISTALSKTDYLHDLDGDGTKESLNLGFTYIPQNMGGSTNANVTDNRTNKSSVPYAAIDVSNMVASAKVYSYKNTNGTSEEFTTDGTFTPSSQGTTAPTVSFTDADTDRVFKTEFDTSDNRWESTLSVNLDNGDYTFSWDKLLVQKHGKNLKYMVKTASGTVVDTSKTIAFTASGVTEYVISVTDTDDVTIHTVYFTLTATRKVIPNPELDTTTKYGDALLVVKSKNGDWTVGIPALEGIKIKYYDDSKGQEVILDLATLTPSSTGKQNGTNNYWEYNNGIKLKVTCGYIHDTKQVYGMPVVVDNNGTRQMYFTISSTNGYVSTNTAARAVTLSYEFTDTNGKTLKFSNKWNVTRTDLNTVAQYSYSDFVNGKMTDLLTSGSGGSSSTCVTPDTLITLADGSQKRVDSLTGEEMLLVWNLETGKYDKAPLVFVDSEKEAEYDVVHLYFSDGTDVKIIDEHGFFDLDLGKYVYVDAENYADYVGHKFIKEGNISEGTWNVVILDKVIVEREVTTAWSPVTFEHLCYYTNGILSMPGGIEGLFNIFEVDTETMRYDDEQMQKDIETYGLFTLEDFSGLIPEIAFEAFNGDYLKVAISKGLLTWEDISAMAERYIPLM